MAKRVSMARQTGPVFLQGTYGNICCYYSSGQWLVRQKSTLTGKRVKTNARFRVTMVYAGLMKRSSKIASLIYRALPEHWKAFWMYRSFVGEAMEMLKMGKTDEEAGRILWERYVAEFGEGYEEGLEFVHRDIGVFYKILSGSRLKTKKVHSVTKEPAGMSIRPGRVHVFERCYEELVE